MLRFLNRLQDHMKKKLASKPRIYYPFRIKLKEQKSLCSADTGHPLMDWEREDYCSDVPAISLAHFEGRGMLELHYAYACRTKTLCFQHCSPSCYKPITLNSKELLLQTLNLTANLEGGWGKFCFSACFLEPACLHFVKLLTSTFLNLVVSGKILQDLSFNLQNKHSAWAFILTNGIS